MNAYDERIMTQLPLYLQMEFPAVLTHRGAVSKSVADLLRPCIQNSVGPERFQKILRELHHLKHDRLELQYLLNVHLKRSKIASSFVQVVPEPFSSFEDRSLYSGYVPCGSYFRTLYTAIIDRHRHKMDKHMMLLDGKVLKGDHSFKFPKHMAKIEETSVFSALYTLNNEYEEIVHQALVPSKSLTYLKHSFTKMHEAYKDYGFDMPIAFFTDNVGGDKTFLESVFDSLKKDVRPLTDLETTFATSSTPDLTLPTETLLIPIERNFELINKEIANLSAIITACKNTTPPVVGFDAEWKTHTGNDLVDVIQIAYDSLVMFNMSIDVGETSYLQVSNCSWGTLGSRKLGVILVETWLI